MICYLLSVFFFAFCNLSQTTRTLKKRRKHYSVTIIKTKMCNIYNLMWLKYVCVMCVKRSNIAPSVNSAELCIYSNFKRLFIVWFYYVFNYITTSNLTSGNSKKKREVKKITSHILRYSWGLLYSMVVIIKRFVVVNCVLL